MAEYDLVATVLPDLAESWSASGGKLFLDK